MSCLNIKTKLDPVKLKKSLKDYLNDKEYYFVWDNLEEDK